MNLRETFAISRLSRVITHRRNTRSHATDQRWHGVPRDTTWGNKRGRNGREPRVARIPHMWFFLSLATSNKRTMRTALYERATQFCLPVTHFRKLTTWLRVHLDHEARWRDTAKQQRQATPWTEFGGSRSYTRSAIDSQPGAAWGASTIRNVETSSSWARYVGHPCLSKTISLPSRSSESNCESREISSRESAIVPVFSIYVQHVFGFELAFEWRRGRERNGRSEWLMGYKLDK